MGLVLDAWSNSPSKTFAATLAAFCIGVLIAPISNLPWYPLLGVIIVLVAIAAVLKKKDMRLAIIVLAALLFGIFRFTQALPPEDIARVSDWNGRAIRVEGVIDGEVEQRINGQRAILDQVELGDHPAFGRIQVWLPQFPSVAYNDRLIFNCRLQAPEPIEHFQYDRFLATRNIYALCYHPNHLDVLPEERTIKGQILLLKHKAIRELKSLFPEPHASFLSGLLFGGSSSLGRDQQEEFSRTGTSHILAASGFNVSLLSFIFLGFIIQTPLGRRKGITLTALLIGIYVVMAGATPAVIRAALMASVLLFAMIIRRRASQLNLFLAVLALMLLANPQILLYDVGFQLSFIATFAVLGIAPRWGKAPLAQFLPERYGIRDSVVGSLAAILFTTPILLWHFGSISLIAPLVNLLILPLIPYLMALALLALAANLVSSTIATTFAIPAWAFSNLILHIIHWYASLPFAEIAPATSRFIALFTGILLLTALLWSKHRAAKNVA